MAEQRKKAGVETEESAEIEVAAKKPAAKKASTKKKAHQKPAKKASAEAGNKAEAQVETDKESRGEKSGEDQVSAKSEGAAETATPSADEAAPKPSRKHAVKKAKQAADKVSEAEGEKLGEAAEKDAKPKKSKKAGKSSKESAEKKGGKKGVSVSDLDGREIKGLDAISDELKKLSEKNNGTISITDIEKATRFLEMSPDEEMDFASSLMAEGIIVISENGKMMDFGDMGEDEDADDTDSDSEDIDSEISDEEKKGDEKADVKDDDLIYTPVNADIKVSDPVKLYLKNIGHFPVLKSKEEETVLAKAILAGDAARAKLAEIRENNLEKSTDPKEIAKLEAAVYDGDEAKEQLTNCNLKLVVSIAKHYVNRGMQFLDLIQEGNIGLMKAVDKFDYTRGFKFSTYATWWIRQAITRALADQARTIRIPVHMVETINKIGRAQRKLVQILNRDPTPDEISDELNNIFSADKIREIQQIALDPLSLEKPVGEEEDSHVGDFIEDKDNESPSEYASNALLKDKLNEVLNDLSERERMVIQLRYGLIDGRTETLEEVGRRFQVTRERIRQIEAKAIKKLRQPKRSNVLKDFRSND